MDSSGAEARRLLTGVLPDQPHLADTLELIWLQAQKALPQSALDEWLVACRGLAESDVGASCALAYLRNAPATASVVGPEVISPLARAAARVGDTGGVRAATALCTAAPKAARCVRSGAAFLEWLRVVERIAGLAPESVGALLDCTEGVLAELDVRSYEAWALGGVRAAAGDAERRLKFFSFVDSAARRWLVHRDEEVTYSGLERRLKAYLAALWGLHPLIRSDLGSESARRVSFHGGFVHVPETFHGFAPERMAELFRAALAHAGAHLRFSGERFRPGTLKPVQIALVSLIEDARVERLAMSELPGLRHLWLPFHTAVPASALTAPALFARLARALIDFDFEDDNAWVQKGRRLFLENRERWDEPLMSRSIGSLLGNDIGQMRVQFNARTYVVEPAYRDDNLGLWDFGDSADAQVQEEILYESARVEQSEESEQEPQRERRTEEDEAPPQAPNRAKAVEAREDESGIPVARYPEWDYVIASQRPDWTTVVEFPIVPGRADAIDRMLERHAAIVNRITALIRSAKVSRPVRFRRQPEGDRLDLDACIEAAVARRRRETPDPRVYARIGRRDRDLAALVLLDVSQSTNDIVRGTETSVLGLEREATALLAHAMDSLGDPFAVAAFCSNGREEVRYLRIKDFGQPFGRLAKLRVAGLRGGLSTRIGTAMRHAGKELEAQRSHRHLLLVVTDGEPSDIDVADRRYLVEDARKAVLALAHEGIDVFCVGLDAGGDSYLSRIFGRRNVVQIDRIERLPEKLPMLYLRLTA